MGVSGSRLCCCCRRDGRQAPHKQRKRQHPPGSSARRRNTLVKLAQQWPLQEEQTALLFQDDDDDDDDDEHDLMMANYGSTGTNESALLVMGTTTLTFLPNLWQAICQGTLTEPLLDSFLKDCPKFSLLDHPISEDGRRAMDWAACRGQATILQLLLEYTSEHAIYTFDNDDTTKKNAIYKFTGPRGFTVLHWAAAGSSSSSSGDCCRILLQKGGQRLLNQPNHCGESVLFHATTATMPFLLAAGANPQLQDYQGRTAVHCWAARRCTAQSLEAVRHLLLHNASLGPNNGLVHLKDNNGDTALHVAARHGHHKMVRLLLQHGTNLLEVTNANGHTALEEARRSQEWGLASWLRAQFPHNHYQPSSTGAVATEASTSNQSKRSWLV